MKKIVLTGGGTAGHVTPNIALLPRLRADLWHIEYIGSKTGIEKELITKEGILYHEISSGKLRRYLTIQNLKDPFKVIYGFSEAHGLLKKIKPDIVFSKGGYVSVPVVIAAKMLKIPVIIHESDITPGLANKIASKGAKKICVNFPETLKYVGDKGVLTGTPIRKELFTGYKTRGYHLAGFQNSKPVLLVMGGSLGSVKVNNALRESLDELLNTFNIMHICGKGNTDPTYDNKKDYKQFEYLGSELPDVFAAAEIMLSRAGANALAEIVALGLPNVLIPLSKEASRGDQILNADSMLKQGYSKVIQEEELSNELLVSTIIDVYENKNLYKSNMKKNRGHNGTENVIQVIKDVISDEEAKKQPKINKKEKK
ncbi:MAG: undecaprenyldiphospho-muramoylpentapeptide beta-N-acetylglucosaminyltransferase [Candidatus Epulonipiscioides saccharophilum]|nr:MAG: undecaprenyldiphospho-muramoylpentapeptide beta-N-acetylglucosaminyltransferase [Epulopiscium sp. AS2M-Bin001]